MKGTGLITTVLAAALVAGVGAYFWLLFPPVVAISLAVAFVLGVAFIPGVAYTFGPGIPGFITEPLANLLWVLSLLNNGPMALNEEEDRNYTLIEGDEEWKPSGYWMRWALQPLAITFDKSKEVFGPYILDERQQRTWREVGDTLEAGELVADGRGGVRGFVHRAELRNDILVDFAPPLERLSDLGGVRSSLEAWAETLEDKGGDTGGADIGWLMIGRIIMAAMGLGMGFVIFF